MSVTTPFRSISGRFPLHCCQRAREVPRPIASAVRNPLAFDCRRSPSCLRGRSASNALRVRECSFRKLSAADVPKAELSGISRFVNRKASIPTNLAITWWLHSAAASCCFGTLPPSGNDKAAQGSRICLIFREGIHFEFRFVNVECDCGFICVVAGYMKGLVGNFQESVAFSVVGLSTTTKFKNTSF